LILDNPITIPRPSSDLLLKNQTELIFDKKYQKFNLILFSKYKTEFSINGKSYTLNKGYNNIILSEQRLIFNNIDTPLRVKGLKISENQKLNWPWFEDVGFEIKYKTVQTHRYLFLKKYKYNLSYNYNFIELGKKIDSKLPNCSKNIISDIDTSLILSVECENNT